MIMTHKSTHSETDKEICRQSNRVRENDLNQSCKMRKVCCCCGGNDVVVAAGADGLGGDEMMVKTTTTTMMRKYFLAHPTISHAITKMRESD